VLRIDHATHDMSGIAPPGRKKPAAEHNGCMA
jgi:hypothetical protein